MILGDWFNDERVLQSFAILALVLLLMLPMCIYFFSKKAVTKALNQVERENGAILKDIEHAHALDMQASAVSALQTEEENKRLIDKLALLGQELSQLRQHNVSQSEQLGKLSEKALQLNELKQSYATLQSENKTLASNLKEVESVQLSQLSAFDQERKSFEDKLNLLKHAEQHLGREFENIANKIFEKKSESFAKSSQQGLGVLLSPLKTQIDEFKQQINQQYVKEGQERAVLRSEILSLKALNQQITEEASALTNALKNDNKQQGNWGEIVLSRVLAESGLREGHEYEVQKQHHSEQGKAYRPDVIVHLPDKKDVVIDSKVSLLAYEKSVNANSEAASKLALKEHIHSIKSHIRELGKKDYQQLSGVNTLDYVLMFMPIEAAFIKAISEEPHLMKLAMDNQIMLVSPSNLLIALRTIHNIWQYEYQNQHAQEIAEKARKMYEKFVGFVDDMQDMGKHIERLEQNYSGAMNKLAIGRGNLISQAEGFKKMGVKPNKSIDKNLVEKISTQNDEIQGNN